MIYLIKHLSHLGVTLLMGLSAYIFCSTTYSNYQNPSYFNQTGIIVRVGTSVIAQPLPLLVFLPATNWTAYDYFNSVKQYQPYQDYIALIPQGKPTREEYSQDFYQYAAGFNIRINNDISIARSKYSIDTGHIYIQGFSLGGDLSRALFMKNKSLYAGATIIGSRMNYSLTKKDIQELKGSDKKLSLMIGKSDNKDRISGMRSKYDQLKKILSGINMRYFSGAHELPKISTYQHGITLMTQ